MQNDLNMNVCEYRGRIYKIAQQTNIILILGEYMRSLNRPNSCFGWEGAFVDRNGSLVYEPGLRLIHFI